MVFALSSSVVRHHPEYCVQFWDPQKKEDWNESGEATKMAKGEGRGCVTSGRARWLCPA